MFSIFARRLFIASVFVAVTTGLGIAQEDPTDPPQPPQFKPVCERPYYIRRSITDALKKKCEDITEADVRLVKKFTFQADQFRPTVLTDEDFEGLTGLEKASVRSKIEPTFVRALLAAPNLTELDFDTPSSSVSEIPSLLNITKLVIGRCSDDKTLPLDGTYLSKFPKLRNLTLRGCGTVLGPNSFEYAPALERLELLDSYYRAEQRTIDPKAFTGLNNLKSFRASGTPDLTMTAGILDPLVELENLNIKKASGFLPETFKENTRLRFVKVGHCSGKSGSCLPKGIFDSLIQLESVDMHFSVLDAIPDGLFAGTKSLRTLKIRHINYWSRVSGQGLASSLPASLLTGQADLETLQISHVSIASIPNGFFTGLSKLKEINLGYNEINDLEPNVFAGLSSLIEVDLRYNQIASIPAELFRDCPKVEKFVANSNDIQSLPDDLLRYSPGIKRVEMNYNILGHLPDLLLADMQGLGSFESLDLSQNFFDQSERRRVRIYLGSELFRKIQF